MTFPSGPVAVPEVVTRIASGRRVQPVWLNELGGVTFAVGDELVAEFVAEFVKVYPLEHADLLAAEVPRLTWARRFTAVPEVLGAGPGWLHTAALAGRTAVDPRWVDEPEVAARAIGAGLRHLHDALPVEECPFDRPSWVPSDAPLADRLVVCHGDACAPNTLMTDDGTFSGHVDIGDLGVADRWADLAIATMSLDWNYPAGFEGALLEAYGVTPDTDRMAYYRRVWD